MDSAKIEMREGFVGERKSGGEVKKGRREEGDMGVVVMKSEQGKGREMVFMQRETRQEGRRGCEIEKNEHGEGGV